MLSDSEEEKKEWILPPSDDAERKENELFEIIMADMDKPEDLI